MCRIVVLIQTTLTRAEKTLIKSNMKKLFVVALLSLAAVSSWAQGTVDFRNGGITFGAAADRFVYKGEVGGTKLVGTNYVAGLYFGTPTDAGAGGRAADNGRLVKFRPTTTTLPGLWAVPTPVSFVLDGVTEGQSTTLQVRVWDATKFSTFDAAMAGRGEVGISKTFAYTVPTAGSTPDKYYMEGLRAFAVNPVPEPSTIALGVLGVAGLLALRRRK